MFSSLDPFEGYVSIPMSLNYYAYVRGNPTNLVDPFGLQPADPVDIPDQIGGSIGGFGGGGTNLGPLPEEEDHLGYVYGSPNSGGNRGSGQSYSNFVTVWQNQYTTNTSPVFNVQSLQAPAGTGGGYGLPSVPPSWFFTTQSVFPSASVSACLAPSLNFAIDNNQVPQSVRQIIGAQETTQDNESSGSKDIALGLERIASSNLLEPFEKNLRAWWGRENIYRWEYWPFVGLVDSPSEVTRRGLNTGFAKAVNRAYMIHFNLEGIEGDPVEYARNEGGGGIFGDHSTVTATELVGIRYIPGACNKTNFYRNGSILPVPDYFFKIRFCTAEI